MALAALKTWLPGEFLTDVDLNAEFANIYNNGIALLTPVSSAFDLDANNLILDGDGDTLLDAGTDDTVKVQIGGTVRQTLTNTSVDFAVAEVDLNFNKLVFDGGNTYLNSPIVDFIDVTINGGIDFQFFANTFHGVAGSTISLADSTCKYVCNGAPIWLDPDDDMTLQALNDDVLILAAQAANLFYWDCTAATPVNGLKFIAASTTQAPEIQAQGTDANIGIKLVPKGTGQVTIGSDYLDHFPAAFAMLMAQATAPTGWTIDTTHTDKALRLVSSGHTSTATGAFTTIFGAGLNTGSTTLTESQIPGHTHGERADTSSGLRDYMTGGGGSTAAEQAFSATSTGDAQVQTSSTGGGASHNHTLSLDLSYVDVIIITKDA